MTVVEICSRAGEIQSTFTAFFHLEVQLNLELRHQKPCPQRNCYTYHPHNNMPIQRKYVAHMPKTLSLYLMFSATTCIAK